MKKAIIAIAILAVFVIASCTPESLNQQNETQLIDKDKVKPPGGGGNG